MEDERSAVIPAHAIGREHPLEPAEPYRAILDAIPTGIALSNERGTILYTNAAENEALGFPVGELVGRCFAAQSGLSPDQADTQFEQIGAALRGPGRWHGKWPIRRKDGSSLARSYQVTPIAINGETCWLWAHEESAGPSVALALADSEARLELATAAADLGIWDWNLETNGFVYSARARQICGFPEQGEVSYEMVRSATHPDDLPRTSAQAQRSMDPAVKLREPYQYRIIRPDGEVRWVIAYGQAQFETCAGVERPIRYVGTLQDITERLLLDEQFAQLAQRLQLALDASRLAVWEVDIVTDTLVGSPDLNRLFGLPEDSKPDISVLRAHYYPGEQERLAEQGRQVIERGERHMEAEYRIIRADGEVRWLGLRCEFLRSEEGQPVRAVGVVWDITQRKAAELRHAVLAELTSRLRDLDDLEEISFTAAEVLGSALRVSRAGYGTIDKEAETITILRDWNAPGITSLAGVLHFRDYGSYIDDLKRGETVVFADAEQDPRTSATAEALKAISAQAVVNIPVTEQGGFVALLYLNHEKARQWTSEELGLIQEVADHTRAVVERRRAERELLALTADLEQRIEAALAERGLLAEIVENTDAFVQVVDLNFRWMAINKAAAGEFERIFGIRPKVGDNMLELLEHLPEQRQAVEAVWSRALAGEAYKEVQQFGSLDRRSYEMKFDTLRDASGAPIGAFQFVYDVTEQIENDRRLAQAEEALRQAQKMEAIGQLTGGVAHDFNNLLTPILGGLDMLQRRIGSDEKTQRIIAGALASAQRAQTLVQRLLAFARRQPLRPTAVDIVQLVDGIRDLIATTVGPQVTLECRMEEDLPAAHADANQLEMALLNLAVNARDAMPGGGRLSISAAKAKIGVGQAQDLDAGNYILIVVQDTGTGMDAATLSRAVEPFFSTKEVGHGTGLGLSMIHGLAAQLGGALRIESRVGQGTIISLFLREADKEARSLRTPPEVSSGRFAATILLVDDEDLVRASTAEMLRQLGCEVVEAQSAAEALKLLDQDFSPDLLVTDHLMPGMAGAELVRIMRMRRPEMPALLISGYSEMNGIESEIPTLAKPFREADLAESLATIMRGGDEGSAAG